MKQDYFFSTSWKKCIFTIVSTDARFDHEACKNGHNTHNSILAANHTNFSLTCFCHVSICICSQEGPMKPHGWDPPINEKISMSKINF